MTIFNWIQSHWAHVATILFILSELLGEIPSIKSNSVFGLIRDFLRGEAKKDTAELAKALDKN
jgi:hypothetical protein